MDLEQILENEKTVVYAAKQKTKTLIACCSKLGKLKRADAAWVAQSLAEMYAGGGS